MQREGLRRSLRKKGVMQRLMKLASWRQKWMMRKMKKGAGAAHDAVAKKHSTRKKGSLVSWSGENQNQERLESRICFAPYRLSPLR